MNDNTTDYEPQFPGLDFTIALVLVDDVLELYEESKSDRTLGDWVLTTYYPEFRLQTTNPTVYRDFPGAQRTSDGTTYLTGLLWKGYLDPKPLQQAARAAGKLR